MTTAPAPVPRPLADAVVLLTAGGVSALIDLTDGRLPALAHWGAELPHMEEDEARAVLTAVVPVAGSNVADTAPRPSLLPEHHTGWVGRPGVRGSLAGRDWSPRFRVGSVILDGVTVSGFASTGAGTLEIAALDSTGRLDLHLTVEMLPSGLLRSRAEITNLATEPYELDDVSLAFPVPREATEILDFTGEHGLERVPQRAPFRAGLHLRENRRGRTGSDSAYLLHAGEPGFDFETGEIWAVHTAWSGNHHHYAERVFTGEQLIGGGEVLLPGELRLAMGEAYTTPWVCAAHGIGLDAIARRFHRHLRSRDRAVSSARPVTLNVWEAVYFDHDADRLIDLAERAAAIGIERYVLDDGWFGSRRDDTSGLGDWTVSSDVWPDGLHPLVDRVRALGMQFGLWFEPEMINLDSDLARAHPDWIMAAGDELPIEIRQQHVLNLSIPAAFEHIKQALLSLIDEYGIDYLKWDHNRDLVDAGNRQDDGRPAVHAQTLAFYRLLDEIRAAHPDLEIESCSSGGSRIDLGVLERTDRVWVSDNIDPHDRQTMMRWTTQLVPPEYLGSHIASGRSHVTGRVHDLSFRAGTALFGHLGVEWDLAEATPGEIADLTDWITFYKQHRHLLLTGDIVRLDTPDQTVIAHGVVSTDQRRAVFAVASLDTACPDPVGRLRLRGLDPARAYRVRPVFPGSAPSGLHPPAWWGTSGGSRGASDAASPDGATRERLDFPGAIFRGAILQTVGLASARIHPDQVLLYLVEEVLQESGSHLGEEAR